MMSKCEKSSLQKGLERKKSKKPERRIQFNISRTLLECFISRKAQTQFKGKNNSDPLPKEKKEILKYKLKSSGEQDKEIKKLPHENLKYNSNIFNTKLLVLGFDQDEHFPDSTNKVKSITTLKNPQDQEKNEQNNEEDDFIASCVRVITEETDYPSPPLSSRYRSEKLPHSFGRFEDSSSFPKESQRNRRSVSAQESYLYTIDLEKIEKDGRTTVMLRNIPNKYTRDMILEEIDKCSFQKKYDFFYLPIDYQNDCNVGYAFINFIHTKFIKDFFERFHLKKWQRFNSQKICSLCYARIQGTLQLLSHFKGSNVLNQRDKQLRPLIDLNCSIPPVNEKLREEKNK